MKAVIGRSTNAWSSTGFAALLDDQTVVVARTAKDLMTELQTRGISEHDLVFSGPDDGDRSLSTAQQAELRAAWLELTTA